MVNAMITNTFLFLENVGLTDVILPFILVFTVAYAVMEKVKIFGDASKKNIHATIALVLGFFSVAILPEFINFNLMLSRIALFLLIIVMFQIMTAAVGVSVWEKRWTFPIFIALFFLILLAEFNILNDVLSFLGDNFISPALIIIFLIAVFTMFMVGEKKTKPKKEPKEKTTIETKPKKEPSKLGSIKAEESTDDKVLFEEK
ncbi:hypothetical protein GOV04_04850 [Candidatus Woesearchaeota archaeon]|nr:hypothetical protein [Candidatus Woesearchaeota archaeon]